MDNPLIFQMLGVLLALFVCFLTYMNTKVWRATHVTFAFLVFVAAAAFMIYASLALKTHAVWKKEAQRLEAALTVETEKRDSLTDGKLAEYPQTTPTIFGVTSEVHRVILDRGRVWRGCAIAAADANSVTLNTAAPPAGADPAVPAATKPNNMQPRTVVHAFKEAPATDPAITIKLPAVYLGVFEATAVTESNVTLAPLLPPDAEQRAELQDANATWALYESMPTDNYDVFTGLTDEQLRVLLPFERTGMTAAEYDALIKSYVRTGTAFDANDRPEDKWVKVKFLKPHKVKVNSDAQGLVMLDGGAFDAEGRAIHPSLRRPKEEEEVEFKIGQLAVFYADDDEVKQLVADRTCELVEELYYRPLNDFSFMFHQRYSRIEEIKTRLKEVARDIDAIKRSDTEVEKQIALKMEERNKLKGDINAAKYELASMTTYHGDLENQLAAVRNQCNEFYRTNKKLGQELTELNARLTEEINAKTRAATASTK